MLYGVGPSLTTLSRHCKSLKTLKIKFIGISVLLYQQISVLNSHYIDVDIHTFTQVVFGNLMKSWDTGEAKKKKK